jgi:hypothetical protein
VAVSFECKDIDLILNPMMQIMLELREISIDWFLGNGFHTTRDGAHLDD